MQVTYRLTLADYKAALRLHRRQKLIRRAGFFFWYVAIPGSSAVAFALVWACSGFRLPCRSPACLRSAKDSDGSFRNRQLIEHALLISLTIESFQECRESAKGSSSGLRLSPLLRTRR